MIGIRADANSIIATGHMMRCMTIAKELVMQGQAVTFFVADEESLKLFSGFAAEDMEIVPMGTDYRDMEAEIDVLRAELDRRHIDTLLVDSYSATAAYFRKLSGICRVAYMDDLKADVYPVDILINYSGFAPEMGYKEAYDGVCGYDKEPVKLLLGLKYAPLRPQFYEMGDGDSVVNSTDDQKKGQNPSCDMTNKENSFNILLSTGGADMCNMIVPVLSKVIAQKLDETITWHVVVGDYVSNPEEIERIAGASDNIELHYSVKDMAGLMKSCDVAVLAAGTMLTECAALRLPAVFYQVADNQKINVSFFGNTGGMSFAGSVMGGEGDKQQTIENILAEVNRLFRDKDALYVMKEHLAGITDGKGAKRIAKALICKD